MELVINSAIRAQLSTLPESDESRTDEMLRKLAQDFHGMRTNLRRIPRSEELWELGITSRLRALVRIAGNQIIVVAVARPDQLEQYWQKRAAS